MKVLVLGAGLVGGPIAADIAKDDRFEVTAADIDPGNLARLRSEVPVETVESDLSDPIRVKDLATPFDFVVSAVPGEIGFRTFKAVIEAGRNIVDIAFFPEDPFLLSDLALKQGVIAIMDCGVAPGMSNILTGYVDSILDETSNVVIYVGGLPEKREWPYEYKAVFSPADVIEEYTRPARIVENGRHISRPALTETELIDFPRIGTLEAFNSDGLRTLASTIKGINMKEKTLRYPGHVEKMLLLRETGFFSKDEIEISGARIRPLDLTSELLFQSWRLGENDVDITVMRVIIDGKKDGKPLRYRYDLYDRRDEETGIHSMARATGYTATVVLRMLAEGLYLDKGVSPPEYIGRSHECVRYILAGLKERGIEYGERIEVSKEQG
ncbi:MAG: saccharopine dehydrogenase NADP-binding domain-containing protein [Candidatus Krumholzibacteriota bacterium]|nr:saccharopine dehydrogenase NADP-binding domain-containing protein [Candidatus Krumholzibacteriota bacterium]